MSKFTIARLTVDRPSYWAGERARLTADWLERQANTIEGDHNLNDTGPFTARRIVANYLGAEVTAAKLRVELPGALSAETRRRIAKWLRSRAAYLRKHHFIAMTSRRGWYVQEFQL